MKLNRVEKLMMNNPVRSWLQRYEAEALRKLGGGVVGAACSRSAAAAASARS